MLINFKTVIVCEGSEPYLFLSSEDTNAVLAAVGALAAQKHAAAVSMVVVQSRAANSVSSTDPLSNSARYDGLVPGRSQYMRSAHLHPLLGLFTQLVRALTLKHGYTVKVCWKVPLL